MLNLSAFLAQNVKKQENVKVVVSNRFTDENGKPLEFELKAITSAQNEEIKSSVLDGNNPKKMDLEYARKLLVSCMVCPDINDKGLQDSYGAMGAEDLLGNMLLPGEYARLLSKAKEINGFNQSFVDLVTEVKKQ